MRFSLFQNTLGAAILFTVSGCVQETDNTPNAFPGYLESDLIEIGSPEGGYLKEMKIRRGSTVAQGDTLFRLSAEPVQLEREALRLQNRAAVARVNEAKLGTRVETVARLRAELASREAVESFAKSELDRTARMAKSKAVPQNQAKKTEVEHKQAAEAVKAARENLALAEKGPRPLTIEALEAEASALQSRVEVLAWREKQLTRTAPSDALVQDTLYEAGEWVPAGRPVVVLRKKSDLRARFFLSPAQVVKLKLSDSVTIRLPGDGGTVEAKIIRIADHAEYTPPVIYSREQSERLVLMVEAQLSEKDAVRLHPGLPVTVELP